ncbi:MAG: NUDIX hydrolase [Pyrinomonadaceae bacterium]
MEEKLISHETKQAKFVTVEQISAGGVAFRKTDSGFEIALISVAPSNRWQLPKGLIDAGETPEIAALREVREEAGIDCDLIDKIETIEYWYVGDRRGERVRFHKFVHFFLMKYASGDVANHDHEVTEARWVKIDKAIEMLAFKAEKEAAVKASEKIKSLRQT